ncbi:MAG: MoxR family ATPase [Candidatus Brocadiae bacterium]|nr:MoxR family ATPase [Candidatus Brocadiia bacterium]
MVQPKIFCDILNNLEKIIQGKQEVLKQFLVCYFAGGHVLLEDVPGVGKTTLAKSLAISVQSSFHRVQFTPDLLPADITGNMIYSPKTGEFHFRPGPIFSDIFLADEINRASPRTQSALLEAMNESQVSIEGKASPLSKVFTVIATQNPVAFHGTYPLPEAQLDRFYMRLGLGYPDRKDELAMLNTQQYNHPILHLNPITQVESILQAREEVKAVTMGKEVCHYLLDIVEQSRKDTRLKLGISPRGSLAFYRTAQSKAWSDGRNYVIPDDLKSVAKEVLSHRIVLETKVYHSGISSEELIKDILEQTKVPV